MGLFPKINVEQITAELTARFNELLAELKAMHAVLDEILVATAEKE